MNTIFELCRHLLNYVLFILGVGLILFFTITSLKEKKITEELNVQKSNSKSDAELIAALERAGINFKGPEQQYLFLKDIESLEAIKQLAKASENSIQNNTEDKYSDMPGGWLDFCVMSDPQSWEGSKDHRSIWLEKIFDGNDWVHLFKDFLYLTNDPYDFPLLGRLQDLDEDVSYNSDEVKSLRNECLRAVSVAEKQETVSTLNKVISACDIAISKGYGLFLSSQ